jgi:hypothetical protein
MKRWVPCAVAVAPALLGCSGPDPEILGAINEQSDAVPAPIYRLRAPLRTLPWVSDFRLGAALNESGRLTELKNEFAPGEPIYLSMQVNDAPRGAVVGIYWYGPDNLTLGYETQTVSAGQTRLRFLRSDSRTWPDGAFRAEVWIADDKIQVKHFDVLAR